MLAVITFSMPDRVQELERCKASVQRAIEGLDAVHVILPAVKPAQFMQARLDSFKLGYEFIAIVDDDDLVHPDAIRQCLFALEASAAGVAFTDERLVRPDGSVLAERTGARKYEDLFSTPWRFHHLTVYRCSALPKIELGKVAEKVGGIEWLTIAGCALTNGAVHIPQIGYDWTMHARQLHLGVHQDIEAVKAIAAPWVGTFTGDVPQYKGQS